MTTLSLGDWDPFRGLTRVSHVLWSIRLRPQEAWALHPMIVESIDHLPGPVFGFQSGPLVCLFTYRNICTHVRTHTHIQSTPNGWSSHAKLQQNALPGWHLGPEGHYQESFKEFHLHSAAVKHRSQYSHWDRVSHLNRTLLLTLRLSGLGFAR